MKNIMVESSMVRIVNSILLFGLFCPVIGGNLLSVDFLTSDTPFFLELRVNPNIVGSEDKTTVGPALEPYSPFPVVIIKYKYDKNNRIRYDRVTTWQGLSNEELLARFIIAEQGAGVLNPETSIDAVGVAWVMKNRNQSKDFLRVYKGLYQEASDDVIFNRIILAAGALGGAYNTGCGDPCPGNAAYAADPESYSAHFGGKARETYWAAVDIAKGVMDGSIPDPTKGARFFSDALYENVPWPDRRTHFNDDGVGPSYSIPELQKMKAPPW
jgi:hypothetical protein